MTWSEEHDVLFCRELIVTQPFQYKAGSREKGQCWDSIACKLNGIAKPFFKVDQRSLRDHLNKLLKEYARKKAYEEKASGIDPEVNIPLFVIFNCFILSLEFGMMHELNI